MKIVQLIGPACAGKSTLLNIIKNEINFSLYDIASYNQYEKDFFNVENILIKDIVNNIIANKSEDLIIIESITGIENIYSLNIRLTPEESFWLENHKKRNLPYEYLKENYYPYSNLYTIDSNYTYEVSADNFEIITKNIQENILNYMVNTTKANIY